MKGIEVFILLHLLENPKELYNMIVYQLGIEQMIKEISNQWKEQGDIFLSFWKGYQEQLYSIVNQKCNDMQSKFDSIEWRVKESI